MKSILRTSGLVVILLVLFVVVFRLRGDLQLFVSATSGPGGGSQILPGGRRPSPGGWNRFVLIVDDVEREVDRLRSAGVSLRSDVIVGVGGKQVLLDDPSGNPVELFEYKK